MSRRRNVACHVCINALLKMWNFRFVADAHWPSFDLPDTLYEYFLSLRCWKDYDDLVYFEKREEFVDASNSHPNFSKFWTIVQEQHPEKKDYFLSLTNEEESFRPQWIWFQYETYLQQKAFEDLSFVQMLVLQYEFDDLRPAAYRAALAGEALRLNCDIFEVRPECDAPPWEPAHEEESFLTRLPAELFGRIFPLLDTLDIFRMTLVCKRWKSIVTDNSMQLKRAEHAISTHIITFTEWMDLTSTLPKNPENHLEFSWNLTRWYCGISENLETLILDYPVPYTYLTDLLQSCPKLKNLQVPHDRNTFIPIGFAQSFSIGMRDAIFPTDERDPATVQLRHMEVFLSSYSYSFYHYERMMPPRHLHRDVLVSSNNLRAFRGLLNLDDCNFIEARKPLSNVFSRLIALDLENFTTAVIETLSSIDNLQLRYLRLGYFDYSSEVDGFFDEEKTRSALHQLLPRLHRLEVLITSTDVTITNETILLLTNLEMGLSVAVFYHAYFYTENEYEELEPSIEKDPLQPDVLIAFEDMLLSKNPDVDLSRIQFVFVEGDTWDSLEAECIECTFVDWLDDVDEASSKTDLCVPQMKRRLGIDF